MTILSKDEKVKGELHRVLGEGQGVGAYNRNRFLLTYRSGGGGMCQSTLNWVYKL